ncbi:zinc finger protein [Macleaya cordata]|uniref:RBR-type E3 ubiquitin transferase n=1 Tax=Macleaya cordata TaxID=56857 RepID=A0A200R5Z0_MACCD|nr:zinc finger protein [Macleaya cordata]
MADKDMESDLDLAFQLQVEEAMTASLIGDDKEISHDVSNFQTLELLKKLEQEEKDRLQWEVEIGRIKDDLKRLVHDQEVAQEILRIPEAEWQKTGDHFQRPFGEGCSSSTAPPQNVTTNDHPPFKLYFKGLFSDERVGDSTVEIAAIGFAVCDPLDNLILNGQKPLIGDWKCDFAEQELELKVEAKALIEGLNAALSLDIKKIDFFCDYYPLYQYITMRWLVNQQNIATVVDQVILLQRKFVSCRPFFVARKDVKFAFKLARDAIDSQITRSAESSNAKSLKETCSICLEDTFVGQMFSIDRCLHRYCCSCMRQHVEVKLLNGMVPRCPHEHCKTVLNIDNSKKFMSAKLVDMMNQRIKEDAIPATEKVYCPNPKCSTLMSKSEIPKYVYDATANAHLAGKCLKCQGYFCFKCKVPWHYDMTCHAYQAQKTPEEDAKLKTLATTKLWRQCMKCNHMIELIGGCYHITCSYINGEEDPLLRYMTNVRYLGSGQEPEPIDWEYYRKGIGSRLVDMYKEAYESIQIPKYVDNVTPQYKPKFDALVVELKEAEQRSLKESERLDKEIAETQELKQKISTMTADEYFAKHPELKKKFDDEIRNDYWGY